MAQQLLLLLLLLLLAKPKLLAQKSLNQSTEAMQLLLLLHCQCQQHSVEGTSFMVACFCRPVYNSIGQGWPWFFQKFCHTFCTR